MDALSPSLEKYTRAFKLKKLRTAFPLNPWHGAAGLRTASLKFVAWGSWLQLYNVARKPFLDVFSFSGCRINSVRAQRFQDANPREIKTFQMNKPVRV